MGFTKDVVRGNIEYEDGIVHAHAALLDMATGSGKTFTIGVFLDHIVRLRNRVNAYNNSKPNKPLLFPEMRVLLLTHRIDLVNQFRDELVHGRDGKPPILEPDILSHFHVSTFHSRADVINDMNISIEGIEEEDFDDDGKNHKDRLLCSTFQTAALQDLISKLDYVDIILVDEAHNVVPGNDFADTLVDISTKGRDGNRPLIVGVTATPSDQTRAVF